MKWMGVLLLLAFPLCAQEKIPIVNYQAFFSSQDHLADELISLIDKERKSVKIAAYCLTHRGVVKALTLAQERGVSVEVLVDPYSLRSKSVLKTPKKAPFPVFVWAPPQETRQLKNGKVVKKKTPLLHDKFCVLGNDRVWTGSFNFTLDAAQVHKENALVVENKELASSYLAEFERLKKAGGVPLDAYEAGRK